MALDGFIPTIWTARLLGALDTSQVFVQPGVANRDYEGEIQQKGDTVRIGAIGDVTVSDYAKNTDINAPEALTDAQTTLTIDQAKYFNFAVDDIDKAQGNPAVMGEAMRRAAYSLRNKEDLFVAGLYPDAGTATGTSGAPKTDLGTAGKAYEYLVAMGVSLDETDTPPDGRWVGAPPWFIAKLLLDDRFVKTGSTQAEGRLANAQVGEAAGFRVLKSNNVSNDGTTWRIMAGVDMAISFAQQITEIEAFRPERRFADAVKGLLVYGAKVVRPNQLTVLYANKA